MSEERRKAVEEAAQQPIPTDVAELQMLLRDARIMAADRGESYREVSAELATAQSALSHEKQEHEKTKHALDSLRQAMQDLADDLCGLQPVMTMDECVSAISQHDFKLRQQSESWRLTHHRWQDWGDRMRELVGGELNGDEPTMKAIEAAIERMRPVYEAAKAWSESFGELSKRLPPHVHKLRAAIDAYQAVDKQGSK